ncbi:MAG: cytochrome c oxidase assembly protein subunit 15 [Planctomycetota bacterium]|jgi:cytochrome c oxidase assembly protein subunit 15
MPVIIDDTTVIVNWLKLCLLLVFGMVILGGVTRLTGSGLSMVSWHPAGVLPPLNVDQWMAEFQRYQQSPEFQKINSTMTLAGFKSIFWFEYSHRMLGRLIGLVFFLPFLYFWFRKLIPVGLTPRLIIMFFLGGFQGLLGWYMVKSGLVSNPHVSQYRLSAHLLSAILIYGFILWTIFDLRATERYRRLAESTFGRWRKMLLLLIILLIITIVSGGFVAGLKAGLIFNTFPLMGGQLIPDGIAALSPWYLNPFENLVTVQFEHRWLATLTSVLLLIWYIKGRQNFTQPKVQRSFKLVGMMVIIQFLLGISTLLLQVPVILGALHQAGALLLFSMLLFNLHVLSRL